MGSLKQKMTDQKRIEFAKQVEYMFEGIQPTWRQVMWLSLLRGIAMGFGVLLGGTLVVALLAWLLGSLESIPLLGDVAETTKKTIQEGK